MTCRGGRKKVDIELYLILSAAYAYVLQPEHEEDGRLRHYVKRGIEAYFYKQRYAYDRDKKEWLDETSTVGTLLTEEQKLEVGRMLLEGVSIESIQEVVRSWGAEDTASRRSQGVRDGWEI